MNASLPPKKGGHNNAMTMIYYVERLLPLYVREIKRHKEEQGLDCLLEQDNDLSHGTRTDDNLV